MNSKFIILILTISVFLIGLVFFLDDSKNSYWGNYFLLISFLLFSSVYVKSVLRLIPVFLLIYLGISLLNISNWRGEVTENVLYWYLISSVMLMAPIIFFSKKDFDYSKKIHFFLQNERKLFFYALYAHLVIVYFALFFIYIKIGPIVFEQSLRYSIPPSLEYIIKSTIPVAAFIPLFRLGGKKIALLLLILLIPTILIGSRGVALIGFFSFFLVLYKFGSVSINVNTKKLIFAALFGLGIIYAGFYLRRTGNSLLATPEELISHYFYSDSFLIYLILPLYLSLRETVGLTNSIINKFITNDINEYPLFLADLFTILPGQQMAAGQSLGHIMGTIEGGGLTPGLLGGLYIDFTYLTPLFFLFIGFFLSFMNYISKKNISFFPVYVVILLQFFHLFHRGFIKPEYITTVMIALFYFLLMKKIKYK